MAEDENRGKIDRDADNDSGAGEERGGKAGHGETGSIAPHQGLFTT